MTQEFAANQKYQAIRKQLDQLHYCLPFNVQSTQLVEKLLNDLLQTTEGYQKLKAEIEMVHHDEKLNQQALVPLQKENEKLTKENNKLHLQVIQSQEQREAGELQWRNTLRQMQDECQDLKFLVESKDQRIRSLEQEQTKLKTQMQKNLERIYLPSQDQIVEGLSQFNSQEETNLLKQAQGMELTNTVQKTAGMDGEVDPSGASAVAMGVQVQQNLLGQQTQWAQEMRKADDRCEQLNQVVHQMQQRLAAEQKFAQELQGKIKVRDEEILRLHDLYTPVQNLEKINLKYQYEQNEQSVVKLQGQVDFLNRENDKLQRQVDILKGDENGKMAAAHYDMMRKEVEELAFENRTLKKDYEECQRVYREAMQQVETLRATELRRLEREREATEQLDRQQRELEQSKAHTEATEEKAGNLRSTYNADRRILQDKINDLERKLTLRMSDIQSLQQKLHMMVQSESSQKNELNFFHGKVQTLRRDLEYQQTFSENMQDQNAKLTKEVEALARVVEMKDKDLVLQRKETAGLREDNERINKMYLLVQKEAFSKLERPQQAAEGLKKGYQPLRAEQPLGPAKPALIGAQNGAASILGPNPNNKKTQNMWQVVDDGFGSSRDLSNITNINPAAMSASDDIHISKDNQVTMKRDFP